MENINWTTVIVAAVPAIGSLVTVLLSNLQTRKSVQLDLMRLQILSKELPADDRLKIYDQYIKLGGNSWLSTYVETVLKPQVQDHFKVVHNRRKEDVSQGGSK